MAVTVKDQAQEGDAPAAPKAPPAGARIAQVTDARNRVLTLKKMTIVQKMRLFEIVGAENSQNPAYLGYATVACHVIAIDGDDVLFPTSKREVEALVQRLDEEGIVAAAMGLQESFETVDAASFADVAKNA